MCFPISELAFSSLWLIFFVSSPKQLILVHLQLLRLFSVGQCGMNCSFIPSSRISPNSCLKPFRIIHLLAYSIPCPAGLFAVMQTTRYVPVLGLCIFPLVQNFFFISLWLLFSSSLSLCVNTTPALKASLIILSRVASLSILCHLTLFCVFITLTALRPYVSISLLTA